MEFIEVANIIAPNLRNEESIELLDQVLNNQFELNSYKPSDLNDLNIMTLHKSKGLEFDVIIHTDLYEWVFPTKLPGKNNDFNNPIYADWDQDLNLHYVGLTRAKKGCILLSSTKRTNNQNKIKNAKDSEFLHINEIHKLRYISKKN
jgi:DNA helicase-2/ATP-dependent DNA helicase PcrA